MKKLLTISVIIAIVIPIFNHLQAKEGETFFTWDGFEADKLASIWLIERFVSPGSIVLVLPKGGKVENGVAFDIPNAAIKRTYNRSSFESLLAHYKISDPRLTRIGMLIHDMEINLWEQKMFKKSREIELYLLNIIQTESDPKVLVEKSNAYFDRLYRTCTRDFQRNEAVE